jgi:hypothetical protein
MKWIIFDNKELAEINVQRINMCLLNKGLSLYLSESSMVGNKYIDNHPRHYFVYPSQDILDHLYSGDIQENTLSKVSVGGTIVEDDPSEIDKYPIIWDICLPDLRGRNEKEINYRNQLNDNEFLYQKLSFTNDGFLQKAQYYTNFVDNQNLGDKVLETNETYTTNPDQSSLFPSQREPISRSKTWIYYNGDGSISSQWTKDKVYDTRGKKAKEGERRRENVVNLLVDHVGLAGVLSGVFTSPEDANIKLTSLLQIHSVALKNNYIPTGRGSIYDDIQSDVSIAWLDNQIVNTPQTQAMCSWMIGLTFREYIIDKLKGNIK